MLVIVLGIDILVFKWRYSLAQHDEDLFPDEADTLAGDIAVHCVVGGNIRFFFPHALMKDSATLLDSGAWMYFEKFGL